MHYVIIITGPCGSGKSTISSILAKKLHIDVIHGDELKGELFPSIENIVDFPTELKEIEREIIKRAKTYNNKGNSVIIDYVAVGNFYESLKQTFGDQMLYFTLLPNIDCTLERDSKRKWPMGSKRIQELHKEFLQSKEYIKPECFLDTSDETAEETAASIEEIIITFLQK